MMNLVRFKNGNSNTGVNHFIDDFFNPFMRDDFFADRDVSKMPAVNVAETDEAYHIEVIAPGMDKGDFKIDVERELLTVSAKKETESKDETKKYSKREYAFSAFTKSFNLPESIDHNKIDASYTDGILMIEIGKKEEAIIAAKTIEIK